MTERVYYTLHVWKDVNAWGSTLKSQYKRFENAHKKFNSLIASREYEVVVLRKQEEWSKGNSCSTPIAIYGGSRKWK